MQVYNKVKKLVKVIKLDELLAKVRQGSTGTIHKLVIEKMDIGTKEYIRNMNIPVV